MKVLLFGGAGQLGYELTSRARDLNFTMIAPVISEVDIGHREQVAGFINRIKPDLIVNSAAYTAVDKAEEERDKAWHVNCAGARNVGEAARDIECHLVHISTDYVFSGNFSGSGDRSLTEEDPTEPLGVYGASKRAGEVALQELKGLSLLIARTSSLHGQRGENFVHTMLRLFEERDTVSVVQDQWMSPTWAGWLAETILDLGRLRTTGLLHTSGRGAITWFEFAQKIYELAKPLKASEWKCKLVPTTADQFGRRAPRPRYSALNTDQLAKVLGRPVITWEEGLKGHLRGDIGRLRS